jgi:hypothetical protein
LKRGVVVAVGLGELGGGVEAGGVVGPAAGSPFVQPAIVRSAAIMTPPTGRRMRAV